MSATTATLDQILQLMNRFAAPSAGVLFAARYEIKYQKGCGMGRRRFGERVLLVHPVDSATWRFPESIAEVAPTDVFFDQAAKFGDALLVRCVEFRPPLDEKQFEYCWSDTEFAIGCAANHPSATAALKQFNAAGVDNSNRSTGDNSIMDSHADFVAAQVKADSTYRLFSDQAPPPLTGEPLLDYRKRLVTKFQQYCKMFAAAKLDALTCPHTLEAIENQVFADAATALHAGATVPAGTLVAVTKPDPSGRPVTTYRGSDGACWDRFNAPIRYVTKFRTGRAS